MRPLPTPTFLLALALAFAWPAATPGQPAPFSFPVDEIERRLSAEPFQIVSMVDNRWRDDRTQRTALRFHDGGTLDVKWARAAEGGFAINNQPQYEVAAYQIQKLFLDPADWVVPPTTIRPLPLDLYRQIEPGTGPTFEGTSSVLVAVQYWLDDVEAHDSIDAGRLDDAAYARRLGYLNLLTYLIRHADSNHGNVLIAAAGEPRMFAVDNGVAFGSPDSPRGTYWKELRVDRLPADAVDRLRRVTLDMLNARLAVVAQFLVREDGRVVATETGPRLNPNRGVDRVGAVIQLGLTDREIDDVWDRLRALLRRVDAGEVTTY